MMNNYWYKDLIDYDGRWQGLEITTTSSGPHIVEMRSGHNGRMALYVNGIAQFWATMLNDYSGLWLVNNTDHPNPRLSLPHIHSSDIEKANREYPNNSTNYWSRYFARCLTADSSMLLSTGNWLIRPMEPTKPITPYEIRQSKLNHTWKFCTPKGEDSVNISWSLHSENFPNYLHPEHVTFIDWWWGGDKLLTRYSVDADSGRIKWWRKKSQEGTLPPILVWFVKGLASFVIIDGHDRLQASLLENIPPRFLILSQLGERVYTPDEEDRNKVLKSVAIQQQKCKNSFSAIDAINNRLISLYTTSYSLPVTNSRATLGDGKTWEIEIKDYLSRHHQEKYLQNILGREN